MKEFSWEKSIVASISFVVVAFAVAVTIVGYMGCTTILQAPSEQHTVAVDLGSSPFVCLRARGIWCDEQQTFNLLDTNSGTWYWLVQMKTNSNLYSVWKTQ